MSTHGLNDVEEEGSPATNVRRGRGVLKLKYYTQKPRFWLQKDAASARRLPNANVRISRSDQSWLPRFVCGYDGVMQLFRLDDQV